MIDLSLARVRVSKFYSPCPNSTQTDARHYHRIIPSSPSHKNLEQKKNSLKIASSHSGHIKYESFDGHPRQLHTRRRHSSPAPLNIISPSRWSTFIFNFLSFPFRWLRWWHCWFQSNTEFSEIWVKNPVQRWWGGGSLPWVFVDKNINFVLIRSHFI